MREFKHKTTEWKAETHPTIPDSYRLKHEDKLIAVPAWMIEDSADWQEVTKDYEILKLRCLATDVLEGYRGAAAYDMNYWDIYSVKRLSDGEVFSVGDRFLLKTVPGTISRFEEKDEKILVYFNLGFVELCALQKSRKPILTSEDGVELFEGDRRWWVNPDMDWGYGLVEVNDVNRDCKYFSTREAAEEYRLNNARVFSRRDVIEEIESDRKKLLKALSDETMYEYDDIFRKAEIKLVKSRLSGK